MTLFLLFFFFRRNLIIHIRFFLSWLLHLTSVNLKYSSVCYYLVFADKFFFVPKKENIFNSKVASHNRPIMSVVCLQVTA